MNNSSHAVDLYSIWYSVTSLYHGNDKCTGPESKLDSQYSSLLLDILEYIGTVKAVSIAISLRYLRDISTEDLKTILSIDYRRYDSIHQYKLDAQAIALVKKSEMLPKRYDADDHLGYYRASEVLARRQSLEMVKHYSFETNTILNRVREIISSVLKTVPDDFSMDRFGPGSTFALKGDNSHTTAKLAHVPECTPLAHDLVYSGLMERPQHVRAYTDSDFTLPLAPLPLVPGDRFALVEKDMFRPRCMAPQPTGNMLAQLAVADRMVSKFHRYSGYKLNEADSIHRHIIESASDLYGTIDLTDASDSISLKFLELVLPMDWYDLIRSLTCRMTKVGDKWYPNQKAFAQGCGLTFITETIVFYAISLAYVESQGITNGRSLVSVYGDDIIVPVDCQPGVVKLMTTLGFAVNESKSYGPLDTFKESCGVDTINGINVRPVYFKKFSNDIEGLTLFANAIISVSEFILGPGYFDRGLSRVFYRLFKIFVRNKYTPVFVPSTFEPFEGIRMGNGGMYKFRSGYWLVRVLSQHRNRVPFPTRPWLSLAAITSAVPSSGEITRRSRKTVRVRWTPHNRGPCRMIAV